MDKQMKTAPPLAEAKPEDFFVPALDSGMWLAEKDSIEPKTTDPIKIKYVDLSTSAKHSIKIKALTSSIPVYNKGLVHKSVLGVGENVVLGNGVMTVNGKYLVNSTAGLRVRIKYIKKEQDSSVRKARSNDLGNYLSKFLDIGFENLPLFKENYAHLPYVIEARNFYNYYHFLKESLPNLILYEKYKLRGPIIFFGKGNAINDFAKDLVKQWFPALEENVSFVKKGYVKSFDKAIFPFNFQSFYSSGGNVKVPEDCTIGGFVKSCYNSCESALSDFRDLALSTIPREESGKHSRRLYVGRRSSRVRRVVGEDILISKLKEIGFEHVFFEDYSIKDQAKLVNSCEFLVGLHGAGMANMIFAENSCQIFELTNLQTLMGRLGDFNPLAVASHVNYNLVVLDHDFDNPEVIPKITKDGHRGVVITEDTANKIISLINN